MYLERVQSKGRHYLYLKQYDRSIRYGKYKKKTIYRFGRLDSAIEDMKEWERDFNRFPDELASIGCTRRDLSSWINNLREKINEHGRST